MSNNNLAKTLTDFIVDELASDQDIIELSPEDDLLEDSIVDSLGIMRLVTFIETNYHLALPAADVTVQNFQTIRAITDYLVPKLTKDVD